MLCGRAHQLGFSNAALHVGPQATEAELHRVHSPTTLHLATHGFVLPWREPGPRVETDNLETRIQRFAHGRHPMLLSGVALAGAQRPVQTWTGGRTIPGQDDGIVTADEIGGLDL